MENKHKNIIFSNMMFEIKHDPPGLYESGNSTNGVIIDQRRESKGYYPFLVDHSKRVKQPDRDNGYQNIFRIPAEVFMKEYEFSPENVRRLNAESENNNLGIVIPDKSLTDRLAGKLPIWYLGKDAFIYDVYQERLTPVDGRTPFIPFSRFERVDDEDVDVLDAYYNTVSRQVVEVDPIANGKKRNKNVRYIMIFGPKEVDPVGLARKEGKSDFTYLKIKEGKCIREFHTILNGAPNAMGIIPIITETMNPRIRKAESKRAGFHH
jgi:hypothetical protein